MLINNTTCQLCPAYVATADFDRDGDEDALIRGGNSYYLELYSAQGPIGTGISFPSYEAFPYVVDYNDDGWPDVFLLTTSFYTKGKIFKNLGTTNGSQLQFQELPIQLGSYESLVLSGDFDHDGTTDFALIAPKISIFLNKGNENFEQFELPNLRVSSNNSTLMDYDNDGDLDIFIGSMTIRDYGSQNEKAIVVLNQTIVAAKGVMNNKPNAPTNLAFTQDLQGIHLTWESSDDHTPEEGLTYDVVIKRDGKTSTKGAHHPVTGLRLRIALGKFTDKATLNNIPPGVYKWHVQAIDRSYVASDLSAEGTFTALPPPPAMNDTTIYLCGRAAIVTAKGTGVQYDNDEALTQLLASGSFKPQVSQTVYVTQTVSGYRSLPKRVQIVLLEKSPAPIAIGSNLLQVCEAWSGSQTIGAQGTDIIWYSDAALQNRIGNGTWLAVQPITASYYVTQTLQGCQSSPLKMDVQKIEIDSRLHLENGKVHVNETNGTAYHWYRNGAYIASTTVPYIEFNGIPATYQVVIIEGSCQETSEPFLADKETITGIEGPEDESWAVFPNPATTQISIRLTKPNVTLMIYDARGIMIAFTQSAPAGDEVIDTTNLPRGLYTIVLDDGNRSSAKRVVLF